MKCNAWMTPDMKKIWSDAAAGGAAVHSVFASAANILLSTPKAKRLFTLTCAGQSRLPDSAHVTVQVIRALRPGMHLPVRGIDNGFGLVIPGDILHLHIQTNWTGLMHRSGEPFPAVRAECIRQSVAATAGVANGFQLLPEAIRVRAAQALLSGNAQAFLGLGAGLTPSFDDACIGVMACCARFGYPVPFQLTDAGATTEISARYLNLALEGYFGEPLCLLMDAWEGKGGVIPALDGLLAVGATSGADMLYGAIAMARSRMV